MMHIVVATFGELRRSTARVAAAVLALTIGASCVSAQMSSQRRVDVTVTDPLGRLVTGLEQARFEVIENGVRRAITDFSNAGAPLSLAIVSEEPWPPVGSLGPGDELFQTPSASNALRQLATAKNSRKVIVIANAADVQAIPSSIQILETSPANLDKAVIELRNQYRLEFESFTPSASVEVLLNQPVGLPWLRLNWK